MTTESPFLLRPHLITANGKSGKIWGATDKINDFLNNINPAVNTSAPARVVQVDQHRVKRYPGDTGYTRKAHQRIYTADLGFSGGPTPGRSFNIEEEVLNLLTPGTDWKVYRFTHTGPFWVLKAFCIANAKKNFRLRSSGGRAHLIEA